MPRSNLKKCIKASSSEKKRVCFSNEIRVKFIPLRGKGISVSQMREKKRLHKIFKKLDARGTATLMSSKK